LKADYQRRYEDLAGEISMFVVWRGWGLLALVAVFPTLASFIALIDISLRTALLGTGLAALGGGSVCLYFCRKWNRGTGYHSLYGIPLEIWGWIYLGHGVFFVVAGTIAWLRVAFGVENTFLF